MDGSSAVGEADAGGVPNDARESTLAALFQPFLRDLEVRDVVRALFDGALTACASGWPRLVGPASLASWLRRSDIFVELTCAPARQSFALAIALHADSATLVVDRLLGAAHRSGAASDSGGPSEAECGLLAYVAARLCTASRAPLIVRDVRRTAILGELERETLVVWPFALTSTFGMLHGNLLISPAMLEPLATTVVVTMALRGRLSSTDTLAELASGDLLVSDEWSLTNTSDGLFGPVLLAARGTDTVFRGQLANGAVQACMPLEQASEDELELVIAERRSSLLELAQLASGAPFPFIPTEDQPTVLRRDGQVVAIGELIVHQGALGLRVREVKSSPG
jgi:hypothetical protein